MGPALKEHDKLREAIAEQNISQAEFARRIGTQSPQVTRWVKGYRRPNRLSRDAINRYFKTKIFKK